MASLKIKTFKGGEAEATVTIPLSILRIASKLIPRDAETALSEKGIDLNQILELSQNEEAHGTLVEIEEHRKNERVIISIE